MTSIFFLVEAIECKQFRWIYYQNNFFLILMCILKIYIKLWAFTKKDDPNSLCISEIMDPEKRC